MAANSAKINIYLPASVKNRMANYPHINWSSIAVTSFTKAMNVSDYVEKEMNERNEASPIERKM